MVQWTFISLTAVARDNCPRFHVLTMPFRFLLL